MTSQIFLLAIRCKRHRTIELKDCTLSDWHLHYWGQSTSGLSQEGVPLMYHDTAHRTKQRPDPAYRSWELNIPLAYVLIRIHVVWYYATLQRRAAPCSVANVSRRFGNAYCLNYWATTLKTATFNHVTYFYVSTSHKVERNTDGQETTYTSPEQHVDRGPPVDR